MSYDQKEHPRRRRLRQIMIVQVIITEVKSRRRRIGLRSEMMIRLGAKKDERRPQPSEPRTSAATSAATARRRSA